MQRATGEPTAKRRIACLVTERDPRNRHPACKPSLTLGMALSAEAFHAEVFHTKAFHTKAFHTTASLTTALVPAPAILPYIDMNDLAIVDARNCLPRLSGIPTCQESLHITRALLRTLLFSPPDSRRGLLLPPSWRLVMPSFIFRFAFRLAARNFLTGKLCA